MPETYDRRSVYHALNISTQSAGQSDAIYSFESVVDDFKRYGGALGDVHRDIKASTWQTITEDEIAILRSEVEAFFERGELPDYAWRLALKDEVVKATKLLENKIRAFAGAPALYSVLWKMLLGDHLRRITDSYPISLIKDGLGKFYGHMQALYRIMDASSRQGYEFAGSDATQNDANLPQWLNREVLGWRISQLAPGLRRPVSLLVDKFYDSRLDLAGFWTCKWNGWGLLSGWILTMGQTSLTMLAAHHVARLDGISVDGFAFKGDDRLVGGEREQLDRYYAHQLELGINLDRNQSSSPYGLGFCSTTVLDSPPYLPVSTRPEKILYRCLSGMTATNCKQLAQSACLELAPHPHELSLFMLRASELVRRGYLDHGPLVNVSRLDELYATPPGYFRLADFTAQPAAASAGLNPNGSEVRQIEA